MNPEPYADYVAALERVVELASALMAVGYDDGPEEIALTEALLKVRGLQVEQAEKEAREGTWGDASDLRRTPAAIEAGIARAREALAADDSAVADYLGEEDA